MNHEVQFLQYIRNAVGPFYQADGVCPGEFQKTDRFQVSFVFNSVQVEVMNRNSGGIDVHDRESRRVHLVAVAAKCADCPADEDGFPRTELTSKSKHFARFGPQKKFGCDRFSFGFGRRPVLTQNPGHRLLSDRMVSGWLGNWSIHQQYSTFTMDMRRSPRGVLNLTSSPSSLPISARPSGAITEISFLSMSASGSPTSL